VNHELAMQVYRPRTSEDRGQTLVELALLLPVLLLLIMGIIEFGWILHGYVIVTSAAREGARVAAVKAPNNQIEERVEGALQTLFSTDDVDLVTDTVFASSTPGAGELLMTILPYDIDDRDSNTQVEIRLRGSIGLLTPLLKALLPDPFPLRATAIMRVE